MELLPSPIASSNLSQPLNFSTPLGAIEPFPSHSPLLTSHSSLLFIDSAVADANFLAANATPGTEVHLLNPVQDAVSQITQTLIGREGVASIQIVAHGADGALQLGHDWLTAYNLQSYASQMQSWSKALTPDADILLYGCNVAQDEVGKAFVQTIAQLTGADVAASDDLTGSSDLGGNWALEYQTGKIEAESPFQALATATYEHTLNVIINEWSQGNGGTKEWVELLVTATTDLRGWSLGDEIPAPGNTYFTFNNISQWQSVAAGTLITVYNGGDRDTVLPADDVNFADGNFTIVAAHTNTTLFTGVGWNGFGNGNSQDNPILKNNAGTVIQDWDQGNASTFTASRPVGNQAVYYTGNTAGGVTTASNYTLAAANNAAITPGNPNGGANTTWINSLRTPIPTVSLSTSTANITEGNTGSYTISRTDTTGALTVNLTIDGTSSATSGDYSLSGASVAVSGSNLTVVIPDTQNSVTLNMAALAEAIGFAEAADTLKLNLATSTGYTVSSTNNTASITIAQNGFTVINTNDSSEGSLRQAVLNANAIAGDDTITFAGTLADATPDTITLTTGELGISSNVTIQGTGANLLTVSGNNATRVFSVNPSAIASFSGLTISGGNASDGFGGGIYNNGTLTVSNSTLSSNTASSGGGIWNEGSTLTVNNSTLSGNSAQVRAGGGITINGGTVSLNNSTLSGNSARDFGGGIDNNGNLTVSNSTFSGNSAPNNGGALWNFNTLALSNSTFSGNTAANGGGLYNVNTINTLQNNLFADSSLFSVAPDATNRVGTAAALGLDPVLRNNGGLTQTHALLAGSAAINAGSNTGVSATDQTGNPRIVNAFVDIGAVESPFDRVSLTATDATATELPGNPGTYRISRDGTIGNLTVNLTIASTSIASATDYTLSSAPSGSNLTVTIPNGQSFVDVTLTPVLDSLVEGTETATLNLASGSYGINPAQATATVNIEDAPVVSLSIPDDIVNEHIPNSGNFRITRTGATAQALTVNYTIAGTATNSTDYTTLTGTATIAAGQASVDVVINPTNDTIDELDETIQITLAAGSYVTTSPSDTGSLRISANDPTVSIAPINASQVEGDAGISDYSFLVSLSHISDETVTVDYQTADGSATVADSDYIAVPPTTLTFNSGTTQQTIAIPVRGDAQFEPDETFGVALSNVTNGSISAAAGTAIGTIANDDGVSSYAFSSAQFFAAEGNATNTSQVVVITRSGNINIASTVDVLLTPGTASAGIDFVAGTVRLSFAVGQTVIVVPIDLFSDTRSEGDETIGLTLLNPSFGGVVGTQAQATLTLVNDDLLPVYDFAASNFRVSEGNGSNTVWLPVTRSGNLFRASFVQVQVYSGSGIAERDFVGGVIAVYFAEGQSTGWLPIQILGNSEYEADKVFTLSFVGFSEEGSYGPQTQASVTIVNDDTLFRRGGGRSGYRG